MITLSNTIQHVMYLKNVYLSKIKNTTIFHGLQCHQLQSIMQILSHKRTCASAVFDSEIIHPLVKANDTYVCFQGYRTGLSSWINMENWMSWRDIFYGMTSPWNIILNGCCKMLRQKTVIWRSTIIYAWIHFIGHMIWVSNMDDSFKPSILHNLIAQFKCVFKAFNNILRFQNSSTLISQKIL